MPVTLFGAAVKTGSAVAVPSLWPGKYAVRMSLAEATEGMEPILLLGEFEKEQATDMVRWLNALRSHKEPQQRSFEEMYRMQYGKESAT